MKQEALLEAIRRMDQDDCSDSVLLIDAKMIAYLLDHCEISIPEQAEFFVRVNCEQIKQTLDNERRIRVLGEQTIAKSREMIHTGACKGIRDFGHTAPDWDEVVRLGLVGLRERATAPRKTVNPDFIEAEQIVWDAAIAFVLRCAEAAERHAKPRMAAGLRALCTRPPQTLFEAMQLILVYYTLQQDFEASVVRTLGRLDRTFLPFYHGAQDEPLFESFIREIDARKAVANMPFTLGGSSVDGKMQINAVSYRLLETYAALQPADTKIHILCTSSMPQDFLHMAMKSVRNGGNSIIFLNDEKIIEGLTRLSETKADATDYQVVGCYEPCGKGEVPCSCSGVVNIPKALELALHGGCDGISGKQIGLKTPSELKSFDELLRAFEQQLDFLVETSVSLTSANERAYGKMHSAPFFSATMEHSARSGGDIYCDHAAKYNNTSLNAIGLATAVDSLAAIRKLCFEEQKITLHDLVGVLDRNWQGSELLRAAARNQCPKFGNHDPQADTLARRILQKLSELVNGRANARGGVYRLGLFSIDWRTQWGARTAASADGRHSQETLSQNTSASFGADRQGATAHILSVCTLDAASAVNGLILDLDLHSSSCRGEKGIDALLCTLETFIRQGGGGVHYNVLNTETLREAMRNPERYENLQIRLCGWNERFLGLSQEAQKEFIQRAEHQGSCV